MAKYAIINKSNNVVDNIVLADSIDALAFIYSTCEIVEVFDTTEVSPLWVYNKDTETFNPPAE